MRIVILLLVLFLPGANALSQLIHIGLLRTTPPTAIWLTSFKGPYTLTGDTSCLDNLVSTDAIKFEATQDGMIKVSGPIRYYGKFAKVWITGNDTLSEIKMKAVGSQREKAFFGDFVLTNTNNTVTIINEINIDEYIAAVVESESGIGHTLEYYKVQTIISRTYAMSNSFKHLEDDGFNLCDNTHCQAYKNKGRSNPVIMAAVKATTGIVMVDDSLALVSTTFHSNCGGQTAASEQVWTKPVPYLRSVYDSYCRKSLNAVWRKEIPVSDWLAYFSNQHGIKSDNAETKKALLAYSSNHRKTYMPCNGKSVAFRTLRADWGLKSAFFTVQQVGENVVLSGRGFGHGVGLCQEGAMKMAKAGKTYREILMHYFTGVHIVNLSEIKFYAEE
ncbi:MAG: SpoIID/LytB domain-containing protein [Flavobacteriales bacterium]